jgi:hypothetical protein
VLIFKIFFIISETLYFVVVSGWHHSYRWLSVLLMPLVAMDVIVISKP